MTVVDRLVSTQSFGFNGDYAPEPEERDDGFLIDLVELRHRVASLVLGEPGIGKSTAFRHLKKKWIAAGEAVELIDLRECSSSRSMELTFERLTSSGSNPILLLDSVDEAPALIQNFVPFLRGELTRLTKQGWTVIAACRTAESVVALDSLFEDLDAGAAHVLLPLRRSDVTEYAASRTIDAEVFQRELARRRLDSLAAIPYTLKLLCDIYAVDGSFPASRPDLFDRAIALSLGRNSVDDYSPITAEPTKPLRQVATAERLAAFATFSATTDYAQYAEGHTAQATQTERLIGVSPVAGRTIALDYEDFQAVLKTPLFASSGSHERRFAHRRLQDFLAAKFLIRHQIPRSQLESLLVVPDGDVIPPQMADVATWLVALDRQAFRWLVELDPISLVRNKIALDVPELAEELVDLLLQRAPTVERAISWRDELSGLEHDLLGSQLGRALRDGTDTERRVALRILSDSYIEGAENEIAALLADRTASPTIRERSAGILMRQRLPDQLLATGVLDPDYFAEDGTAELRGLVLRALWPEALSPELLIQLLVPPPEHFVGSYSIFLRRLTESLTVEYAAHILLWAASRDVLDTRAWNTRGALRSLVERAMAIRISALTEDDPIPADVVTALHAQISAADRRIPVSRASMRESLRRNLVRSLATVMASDRIGWFRLRGLRDVDGVPLLDREDLPWMLGTAKLAPAAELTLWVELIDRHLDSARAADMELIWETRDTPLWEYFRYRFDAIALDSEYARRAIDQLRANRDEMDAANPVEAGAMSAEEYNSGVRRRLQHSRDDARRFWDLARWLNVDLEHRQFGYDLRSDLLSTNASRELDHRVRTEVCGLAINYLTDTGAREFFKPLPRRVGYGSVAAYQALHTVFIHERSALDGLSPEDWSHLNAAILEFPAANDVATVREELLHLSFAANAVALTRAIRAHLGRVSRGASASNHLTGLEEFIEPSMAVELQNGIRTQASARAELATLYLKVDLQRALHWMRRRIERSSSEDELATILERTLRYSTSAGMELLELLLTKRPTEAPIVLPLFADLERFEPVTLSDVDVRARVRVYEAVASHFPPGQTFPDGVHSVSPREELAEWRDQLLASVVNEGTRESFTAVVAVAERVSGESTTHAVTRAREAYRMSGWSPLSVSEFHAVLERADARLIRSARDVKIAAIDALGKMSEWLRGETPQAFALWNTHAPHASPKDENRISDWYSHGLRLLLAQSGLVINREVEITSPTGRGVGRRNDIRIEARDPENGESYVVVVEVKGIWNREVRSSLPKQLARDYLTGAGLTHGIYLVVTFPKTQITDPSKAAAVGSKANGLQAFLDAQAEALSPALDISAVIHDARLPSEA